MSDNVGFLAIPGQPRDPLQAWPIIDGPMQGKNWAHADDYFYAAELVVPPLKPETASCGKQNADTGRTLYRLRLDKPGTYVWTCRT